MRTFVDWESEGDKFSGQGSGQFLKLSAGNKYKVRLISKPVRYLQHWEPIICRSPGWVDVNRTKSEDPLIEEMGMEPKKRYSIWVFDRNDNNKIKLMDFPPSLFDQFVAWKEAANEEPGGKNGPDWMIELKIPPGASKRRTKYSGNAIAPAPFTEDEIQAINDGNLVERINELRKPNTPDEIRQMLRDRGESAGQSGTSATANATVPTTAPTTKPKAVADSGSGDADSGDDILF